MANQALKLQTIQDRNTPVKADMEVKSLPTETKTNGLTMTFTKAELRAMTEGDLISIVLMDYRYRNKNLKADDVVAEMLGVSVQTLSNLKSDKGHIGVKQLRDLYTATKCKVINDWVSENWKTGESK